MNTGKVKDRRQKSTVFYNGPSGGIWIISDSVIRS